MDVPGPDPETAAPARRSADPRPGGPTQAEGDRPAHPAPTPPAAPAGAPPAMPADRPVLPDVTSDERDVGWGDWPEPSDDDRYLREVPPHHGG